MQGATHRVGGALCAVVGYSWLQSKGLLASGVNPLLQLTVMYPFAVYGAILPDLDQNWNACPSKDIISYGIHKVLHLGTGIRQKTGKNILPVFDAKHRSWQTHSLESLLLMIWACIAVFSNMTIQIDALLFRLVASGLVLGVVSHLILDLLTPEGIVLGIPSLICRKKKNLHLMPKSKFFATGGPWETVVRYVLWVVMAILLIRLVYLALPYRISLNL